MRGLTPRSYCSGCARPFYSDKRRPCRCGETARIFWRGAADAMKALQQAAKEVSK